MRNSIINQNKNNDIENSGKDSTKKANEKSAEMIIPLLENGQWVKDYERSLNEAKLEELTMDYLNSIQRTPNELKKTLVRQTFSGTEPEHGQIIEFLLVNAVSCSIPAKKDSSTNTNFTEYFIFFLFNLFQCFSS